MTDRETAGARWFREEQARRAKEAADQASVRRRKALDVVARAREAQALERQRAFGGAPAPADEERALVERILAATEPRVRERLEAELTALRARMRRGADPHADATSRGAPRRR